MVLQPGHWSHCAYTPSAASWVTGYGSEGLGIPSPLLGWPLLLLEARVVLASAVFFLVLFVEGDMECGWFLLVSKGERGAGEFWSASSWLRHGERLESSGCCVANGCF